MGKLITVTEASEMLGVSRQSLTNWAENGILKFKKMGKGNASLWVNKESIEALAEPIIDIDKAKKLLEEERRTILEKEKEERSVINDITRQIRITRRFANMVIATEFDREFINTMFLLGKLKQREAEIMARVVRGDTISCIAEDYGLSRSRVMQVFYKGCRRCRNMDDIMERLNEAEELKIELTALRTSYKTLKNENDMLRAKLDLKTEQQVEEWLTENDEMFKLLNTKLVDCNISVRSLNCVKAADIETIGDLVKCQKTDLLKFRNFGRKSLTELDDFIEGLGLKWSMDVDRFFRERIDRMINKEKDDNTEHDSE